MARLSLSRGRAPTCSNRGGAGIRGAHEGEWPVPLSTLIPIGAKNRTDDPEQSSRMTDRLFEAVDNEKQDLNGFASETNKNHRRVAERAEAKQPFGGIQGFLRPNSAF